MFNFTTQNVLNHVTVWPGTGSTKGCNVIVNTSGRYPQLRIGNVRFNWPEVLDIYAKKATPESLASVTFNLANIADLVDVADQVGTYRIALYIGLSMNSQDSFYANDFVYKGKPFYIEFAVKTTEDLSTNVANLAKKVKQIAEHYLIFQADEKIMTVTTNSGEVTFTATNGYQIIQKAFLQKFDEKAIQVDCCTNSGEFVNIVEGIPCIYTVTEDGVTPGETLKYLDENGEAVEYGDNKSIVPIIPGAEAFCDYNWIIHNLRLPTGANTQWWSPVPGEMPMVGGTYDQYIIRLIKDRDGIAGGILGQRATTVTTHVFYVLSSCSAEFENALANLGASIFRTGDVVLDAPYGSVTKVSGMIYEKAWDQMPNKRNPAPYYLDSDSLTAATAEAVEDDPSTTDVDESKPAGKLQG